jgi:hypothetical protein
MPPPTIATRVARIEDIALSRERISGSDRLDVAADLLADLQHWCRANRTNFDHALRRARMHFDAESLGPGA